MIEPIPVKCQWPV